MGVTDKARARAFSGPQLGASGDSTMSDLNRDVCVYNNGHVVEWIVTCPIPLADGRIGVRYKGLTYPLLDGDVIDLEEPSSFVLRGRHQNGAAGAKGSPSRRPTRAPLHAPSASPEDHVSTIGGAPAGVGALLPFEVLPPGEAVRDFATTLRKSGQYKDSEIDLRRLQVLVDLEHHFSERRCRRYRSGFPSTERDNGYIVLAIEIPNGGGEDAVAISPLKGEHATFLVRYGRVKSAWRIVLSKTKAEAVELGADRLVFKGRAEQGLDRYAAMLDKLIELLEGGPNGSAEEHLFRGLGPPSGLDSAVRARPEAVVDTPEELECLFEDRPQYRVWAAFASELVKRRNRLQPLVDEHRRSSKAYKNRRVRNIDELEALHQDVLHEMMRLVEKLERDMWSAPFQRLFVYRDPYDEPTPQAITEAAAIVIDFYRANLLLARETRAVEARDEYAGIIENIAHLVDRPLEGVDQFIAKFVGFIGDLPTLQRRAGGRTEKHPIQLEIEADGVLMKRINRQLRYQRQPWRRWLWPW